MNGPHLSPEQWSRARVLFDEVVGLPGEERAAYLHQHCGADRLLHETVAALLEADAAPRVVLDASPEDLSRLLVEDEVHPAFRPGDVVDRYTIEREIGHGGHAVVYLAQDRKHGRQVALKVLQPELAHGINAERFQREIQIAAHLTHPHIVPLHDSGEVNGVLYYVMPYVEGESLRERLRREQQLPVEDALRIAQEVASALSHAHGHGVVHRDVKPENILLAEGVAVVADFGIARAITVAAGEAVTQTGIAIGTPAYMSPEQVSDTAKVDGRSDIYSLGCVLYEMLVGHAPYSGATAQEVLARHALDPVPTVRAARAAVPAAVERAVTRALAKQPADRFVTAAEFAAALTLPEVSQASRRFPWRRPRTLAVVAGVLLVALTIMTAYWARRPATPERPVLAVLPFENLGATSDAYFTDGLTDEVRARLASVPGLQVIGGMSARQYKGSTKPPREIARELGATHLLTGTVRWERMTDGSGSVRVSPELVRAADQKSVWAEPVEAPLGDVFALQGRIAERVAAALNVALLGRERLVTAAPMTNPAAYDAYLRGLAYSADPNRFSAQARRAAIAAFEQAVALDPRFAAAHARLAMAYLTERGFGFDSGGLLSRAQASVDRAMTLDSTLKEAQLALGQFRNALDDPEGTYRAFQAAAQIAPGDAEVLINLAYALESLGRLEEAIPLYQRLEQLEPRWADPPGQLAGAYDQLFRYEEALRARERSIALNPGIGFVFPFQAATYLLWRADTAAARRVLETWDPRLWLDDLTRLPSHFAGRAIWWRVMPTAALLAKDTITPAAYVRGDWGTLDLYHLMKARHFAFTGRPARARAHADSVIALDEPVVRHGPGTGVLLDLFTPQSTLAEAYAYAGRPPDAARLIDQYVEARRQRHDKSKLNLPYALVTAAYVDVLIGRRDLAVARLEEAMRLPGVGLWISRALLRADPSWAPLRGHRGFEHLIAGSDVR